MRGTVIVHESAADCYGGEDDTGRDTNLNTVKT